jgi:hypothetical protein
MNFPIDEPIFQFFYWLVNTPGLGGIVVGTIIAISLAIYAGALLWIARGARSDEMETYAYPTPSLEHQ